MEISVSSVRFQVFHVRAGNFYSYSFPQSDQTYHLFSDTFFANRFNRFETYAYTAKIHRTIFSGQR